MVDWLVVMREELMIDFFMEALVDKWGVEVLMLYSPYEALDWIDDVEAGKFQESLPKLAYMNVFYPDDIRGTVVARRLRESPLLNNIAIVLMDTGNYPSELYNEIMEESDADVFNQSGYQPKFSEFKDYMDEIIAKRDPKA